MGYNGATGEIGGIEGIEQLAIVLLGIALWQEEGLGGLTIGIQRREIDTGVKAIVPTTGKEKPSTVGCPVMQALGTWAVHFCHTPFLTCLNIQEPQVGLRMPDGEITIVYLGIHDVAAVVGWLFGF